MKPPPFEYAAPETLDEALELLAGEDAKALAGGQSLVPLLNFRFARPRLLVDLNGLAGLDGIRVDNGTLFLGALVRQAELERSAVAEGWPLLHQAIRFVGHQQTRTRGTVGGSVVHADPAAELPCVLATLDARFHVRSRRGARVLSAAELFVGPLFTSIEPDELLVEIEVPAPPADARSAFVEYARTHGDFASLDEIEFPDDYLRALVHELLRSVA